MIALIEAGNSHEIRDIASRIAATFGVVRCVVCSERELTGSVATPDLQEWRMTITAGALESRHSSWTEAGSNEYLCG